MIESFSALIFAKAKFKGDSSFKSYLFAIARNLAFKYLKHNKRYESIENVQNEQVDIEKEFITKQQNIALYRGMKPTQMWMITKRIDAHIHCWEDIHQKKMPKWIAWLIYKYRWKNHIYKHSDVLCKRRNRNSNQS